ncbi:MAG: hypothetical protein LBT14_01550, partial [Treponema sp.]|nr:hypothetical protein [Treponema sp.]
MFNLIYTAYNYSVYYGETENIYFILTGDFSGTELTLAATFEYRGYYIFGENLTVSDYDKIFHTAALSNVRRGLFWYATNHLSALFYNDALNIKGSMGLNFYPYTLSLRGKISLSETAFIIEDGAFSYYYDVFNFDANTAIVLSGAITFSFDCVLSKIGAGLVWATPADSNENDTETYDELEAYYHGFVKTFQNPVVAEEITAKLSAVVNPFQIENHSETYFTFTNNFSAESVFTDVYGKPLQITATSGSKLCFEKRAEYLHNDGAKCCYYLGFAGVYRLSGGANFLCGLSGTEFIKQSATADDNFNIAFVGGQNSFVDQGGEFLDYTTCAYLQFTSNADYFCQSSDAPFFSSVPAVTFGNVETAEAGVLAYLPLKLVSLNDAPPVPVFPQNHTHVYDGIIPDFIPNSIYQKRFDLLAGKLLQQPRLFAESNAATMAITKNGLIVGLDSANIDYAVLAVNADNEQIRLANIDQTLRTALQDADAKVLFATPANFKQYTEAAACRFKLGSWLFDFSADNWRTATPGNDAPTLILLKYSADTNIREYMGGAPAFEVAYKKCFDSNNAPLPYFADFIEAVNSPTFSGMLILNYPASFEAPTPDPTPDITMIINGVKDKSEIFAHHLIIKAGKVEITGGGQVPHISSVGGVIDYNAEEQTHVAHTGTPPDYEFTTTRILSVFADNTQTAFTTRSELLINKLFETPATKSTGGGNSLLIDGILTKTDTNYFFVYKTNESGVYSLPTSLLEKVEINDVTLSTGSFTLGGGLFFPLPVS